MNDCKTCNYFKDVFRRFYLSYVATDGVFYCEKHERMAKEDGCCDCWQPIIKSVDLSKQRFDEAEEDIKFILRYLKSIKE